jgi:hypothetical protein
MLLNAKFQPRGYRKLITPRGIKLSINWEYIVSCWYYMYLGKKKNTDEK